MSIYLENLHVRLVEELKRVGPPVIATQTGIARATVYNWMEKGNVPMDKLALLETAGADVNYILTGQRSGVAAAAPVVAEPAAQLSRRALAVAQNYEATSEEGKKIIEAAAFAAAKPAAKRGAKAA